MKIYIDILYRAKATVEVKPQIYESWFGVIKNNYKKEAKKKMKRYFFLELILILIAAFLVPANAPAERITLKLSYDSVPQSFFGTSAEWLAKEVKKATQGRIVIDTYPMGAISQRGATLDNLNAGVTDLAVVSITEYAKAFPLSVATCMPGTGFPDTMVGKKADVAAFLALLDKYPEMAAEWKDYVVITHNVGSNVYLFTSAKPVRVPADVKGLKIGSLGLRMQLVGILGAAPVVDPPPQAYQNLQTGITEATTLSWPAMLDFETYEVVKYGTYVKFGETAMPLVMSREAWNRLSKQDQKLFMDLGRGEAVTVSIKQLLESCQACEKRFEERGRTMVTWTPEEEGMWEKEYEKFWRVWASKKLDPSLTDTGMAIIADLVNAAKKVKDK